MTDRRPPLRVLDGQRVAPRLERQAPPQDQGPSGADLLVALAVIVLTFGALAAVAWFVR